jgi:hypothetical protein
MSLASLSRFFWLLLPLTLARCTSPPSVVVAERWGAATPQSADGALEFVETVESSERPLAWLRVETVDPSSEEWRTALRREACALGGRVVRVEPWRKYRNARRYCGVIDSLCREQITRFSWADAFVYAPDRPGAPDAATTEPR